MSKEETLNSHLTYGKDTYDAGQRDNILKAMDEYAKQEAIGFAAWVGKNRYTDYGRGGKGWHQIGHNRKYTISELYSIYLNSKK